MNRDRDCACVCLCVCVGWISVRVRAAPWVAASSSSALLCVPLCVAWCSLARTNRLLACVDIGVFCTNELDKTDEKEGTGDHEANENETVRALKINQGTTRLEQIYGWNCSRVRPNILSALSTRILRFTASVSAGAPTTSSPGRCSPRMNG